MTTYPCDIVDFPATHLAVLEAQVKGPDIPQRIPGMLERLFAWAGEHGLGHSATTYAVYDEFSANGMRMRIGIPVSKPFAEHSEVKPFSLPACRAAHLIHRGSYAGLFAANDALNQWAAQQNLRLSGTSWERYGDWNPDESKLVTDIYLRLT